MQIYINIKTYQYLYLCPCVFVAVMFIFRGFMCPESVTPTLQYRAFNWNSVSESVFWRTTQMICMFYLFLFSQILTLAGDVMLTLWTNLSHRGPFNISLKISQRHTFNITPEEVPNVLVFFIWKKALRPKLFHLDCRFFACYCVQIKINFALPFLLFKMIHYCIVSIHELLYILSYLPYTLSVIS